MQVVRKKKTTTQRGSGDVCVTEWQREIETETQRDRKRHRHKERQSETERDRETEREIEIDTETDRDRQRDRDRCLSGEAGGEFQPRVPILVFEEKGNMSDLTPHCLGGAHPPVQLATVGKCTSDDTGPAVAAQWPRVPWTTTLTPWEAGATQIAHGTAFSTCPGRCPAGPYCSKPLPSTVSPSFSSKTLFRHRKCSQLTLHWLLLQFLKLLS